MAPPSAPMFQNVVTYKPNYDKIAKSALVTFLIGPDKFPMAIHAGAVKDLSTKLSAMVEDATTKDSRDDTLTLKDINVASFRVFTEFAYTGDYSNIDEDPPSTKEMKRNADEAGLSQEDTACKKQSVALESSSRSASSESVKLVEREQSYTSTGPTTEKQLTINQSNSTAQSAHFKRLRSSLADRFKTLGYGHGFSGLVPSLHILVELYAFATEYSIEALRQKTISSTHEALCGVFNEVRHKTITYYIKSMYALGPRDKSGGKCQLRDLGVRYAVAQAGLLHRSQHFEELLKSNGDFAVDFFRALAE